MAFPNHLKIALASQAVAVDRSPAFPLSSDTELRIEEMKDWSHAQNGGVAVSYFFRQYALFVSSQFELITHHNGYFNCTGEDLAFNRVKNYGFNVLETHVSSSHYMEVGANERFDAFHHILHEQTDALIESFRRHVKISPLILWDNVLGSLIWFYANLEQRNPRRAAEDLEWLLDARNWAPLKKSQLARLLGDTSLGQAVSRPLRKTCCLYKELPHFDTCTFCPQPN
ncbi:IucA/IucC family C-terminal-domain containing protein [Planococcus sp. CAU13]|uniref:IucA/IucC family C-terminal-domain containing protein n=1 Tax=Planococcus sp. CAU13 TaxID=1541197 RepID=UPI00053001C9|nr:IucA/IucC family C-terminal-domain containing protein [Planococcus sp. CAU13]